MLHILSWRARARALQVEGGICAQTNRAVYLQRSNYEHVSRKHSPFKKHYKKHYITEIRQKMNTNIFSDHEISSYASSYEIQ